MEYIIQEYKATKEEYLMWLYFKELKSYNIIKEITFQPKPFIMSNKVSKEFYVIKQLKTKTTKKILKRKNLINEHIYTPDYKIIWNTELNRLTQNVNNEEIDKDTPFIVNKRKLLDSDTVEYISYIEVKPEFDMHGKTQMFRSYIQPIIYSKYDYFVQLIKPITLFKNTFVPSKFFAEKSLHSILFYKNGTKKHNWNYDTYRTYINNKRIIGKI